MLDFMMICNDPEKARAALDAGVNRIFVDLEQIGKRERQQGHSTVISSHMLDDIAAIREALPSAELLVRTNPIHDGSCAEVDEIVSRGANVVMLPMFREREDVSRFVDYVRGRARICLLVETPQAFVRLPCILELADSVSEVYVGLNDLHLGLGLRFMFECLAGGLVDHAAALVREKGLRFGFGGLGRIHAGVIPAEMVLAEHVRLGSSLVILSRTFLAGLDTGMAEEISLLRAEESRLRLLSPKELECRRRELCRRVWEVAAPARPLPAGNRQ